MTCARLVRTILIPTLLCVATIKMPLVSAQQPVSTTICDVMHRPSAFAGHIVKLRATVETGMEASVLIDANNSSCKSPWLDWAPIKGEPSRSEEYDTQQRRFPVFLVEDENLKHFEGALNAVVYPRENHVMFVDGGPKRYTVTATMTGRVDYAGKGLGFGHLNGWEVRFVLSSVEDVAMVERTYDWTVYSREPVRFPHGTISGKLTNADGKPIKTAWIGAIPAKGKVPIGFKQSLTKDDGSYTFDLDPGIYFVVVNRISAATEDVPVLTTYFPSSEVESGATPLKIDDYTNLTGINLHINRTLTPIYINLQVFRSTGEPAAGAYAYLTQTNQAGLAGEHGVTHLDSAGRARLFGFEGVEYLVWAASGSWPSEQCAPIIRLDRSHPRTEPIVMTISMKQAACSKQEEEARAAAYATQAR